jgi:hypothetical protein
MIQMNNETTDKAATVAEQAARRAGESLLEEGCHQEEGRAKGQEKRQAPRSQEGAKSPACSGTEERNGAADQEAFWEARR